MFTIHRPKVTRETKAHAIRFTRHLVLHSAMFVAGVDFAHCIFGHNLPCDGLFCAVRENLVSYSALAAIAVVYLDDGEHHIEEVIAHTEGAQSTLARDEEKAQ